MDLSQFNQPRNLNKGEVKTQLERLVPYERKVIAVVIEHIAEVERRRLYLDWDFTSLYEYLTRGLGYSESAAYRRMQAARAMIQMPEIKEELEKGSLNLSQISLAQTAIRQEQKKKGSVSLEEKRELFSEISNKTAQETLKILDETFELPIQPNPTERHRRDDSLDLQLNFQKEAKKDLLRVREIYSHLIPDGNWNSVFAQMAKDVLKQRDPLKKNVKAEARKGVGMEVKADVKTNLMTGVKVNVNKPAKKSLNEQTKTPQSNTDANVGPEINPIQGSTIHKTISVQVRRHVFQRDQVCQHRNQDGSLCGSKYQLELDHIHPKFAGGSDHAENLRLLCRIHNVERYRRGA